MVKCAECGFLSQNTWAAFGIPHELIEVPIDSRTTGQLPGQRHGFGATIQSATLPTCFVRATSLEDEIKKQHDDLVATGEKERGAEYYTLKVITKVRSCDGYVKWSRGFTPKEHREMLDRQWMMEREERRDKELRDWQERMEGRRHGQNLFWFGIVATVAIVAATIIGAYIERGSQPPVLPTSQPSASDTGGSQP